LAANSGGHLQMFDTATRKPLATTGDGSHIFAIAFSPDSTLLAAARGSSAIDLLSADKLEKRKSCTGHTEAMVTMAFSPDGKFLASAGHDKTVRLWNVATGKALATLGAKEGITALIRAIAFTSDGKTLLTAGDDDTIRIWRIEKR
jgi:WD40 repeat protein